ncbi:hypothetical protein F0562_019592 [Nyssa sinensis]|uniref:Reverse transcriptase domain-containing protein n=1 Tax=Nyssa sinensis TaxID=561372 RepID=A0A5J5BSR5_9ASTE|nr:hypothetical protein F0562_019592 [Nyssa sinensis]
MNSTLLQEFNSKEIKYALFRMHPSKAPGPDGSINHTYIVLTLKVNNPKKMTEFRLISLCNVAYKVIAKVLANILKPILPLIILESPSAFVPGRLITDNILVAFEIIHCLKNSKAGKQGNMALKLVMNKAYHRVEWKFLEQLMLHMGFHARRVELIIHCVSLTPFSVLINRDPMRCIRLTRALCQGNPPSPYLFILCAEAFSYLLMKAEGDQKIKGLAVARNAPRMSHLFFADDSLLFSDASIDQIGEIARIISIYGAASSQ